MLTCANCGTENPSSSKFCASCGTRLSAACTNCGTALLPGARFCSECGTPVAADQPAPGAPGAPPAGAGSNGSGPQAERRLVTVLFADLVGFTPFAEERDAEDVRDTLSRYFEMASEVVSRYGGTVEKFIGDAVMAVWGTPTAHEDDAERAVRAGLDLVGAVQSLGPSIQARAGILTGEAAVTLGATNQGMVAGDLVNTASRLQSAAAPGSVLAGEATMRAASGAIAFEPAGDQSLKGKAAPVSAWRALRVVAERGGRNRSEALEAPFVGRDDELRLIKELFHATGREQRARLVSVIGPAGIGKSRLAWEFLKYLDGLVENVWWHHGRSPAYGEGITFWALGEMVRGRAGLLETDDEATTRAKVAATLEEHVPDAEERGWIEPALLTLLGIERGQIATEQLFAAWRLFFERLSATSTVIMVFEDLHWADAGLLEFIDSLLEWSRAHPICIVTLARPELLERKPDWGAGQRNFTSLFLEPLSPASMRELLAGLVPGLPDAAVTSIVERADGVPLYAVETVRMLLAEGRLAAQPDGTYAPVGAITQLAVPESLTALIAARLDALDPSDRSLLQDAAVLGQSFAPAAVAAVSGFDEAALEPRLRALVRRELLTVEADPRSPERGQYSFVQALIREVAYNTLAKKERKTRHVAAARYYEALDSDEIAGALAGHYLAAHGNATEGAEADALAVQARIALRAAGERAASLGSHDQARSFFAQALSVTTDTREEAELLERMGASAGLVNRVEDMETAFRGAIERWTALGDRSAEARTIAAFASGYLASYRMDEALALLGPASARFADMASDPSVVRLNGQLARAHFLSDDDAKAAEIVDPVLSAAEHADLFDVLSDTLITKGGAYWGMGRRREGLGLVDLGRRIAEENGFLGTVQRALNNLASELGDEDPRAALEAARQGLAISKRLGTRPFQVLDNAAGNALRVGEWDWAIGELEARYAIEVEPLARTVVISDLYLFRSLRGEPLQALIAEADALVAGEPDASLRMVGRQWMRMLDGFLAGDHELARTSARRVAAAFEQSNADAMGIAAHASILAADEDAAAEDLAALNESRRRGRAIDNDRASIGAGIAAIGGRAEEALTRYRDVLKSWRELGTVWDEALTGLEMATNLDPNVPEVRAAADASRAIYLRLGASPMVERLDVALERSAIEERPSPAPPVVESTAAVG
jgi:class 3 adenylate cyclase